MTVRKTVDTLIATFCIENSHQLLHQDRDFSHFEKHLGLRVL
jgi:predicted nucleic acid-binding protein